MYKTLARTCSGILAAVLLCSSVSRPVFAAGTGTSVSNQGVSGVEAIESGEGDYFAYLWEIVQQEGEDIITFPSRMTEELLPGEAAYYGFHLKEDTNLNISLDADYPCYLILCQKDKPVNVQTLPFATQKIEESNIPSGYYQVYVIPQEEYETENIHFTLNLGSFSEEDIEPDFSEFDPAGKLRNKVSPFNRFLGSDYPVFEVKSDDDEAPDRQPDNTKDRGEDSFAAGGYFLNWLGPVEEDVMPGVEGANKATPSNYMQYVPETPSLHVQEMIVLPSAKDEKDIGTGSYVAHWKNALMTYGAMDVGMLVKNTFWADSPAGEEKNKYYYVPAEFYNRHGKEFGLYPNHDVTLIGWDDTVPKERFRVEFTFKTEDGIVHEADYTPQGDGAWIVRNSWGSDYHAGGDFYISYYDALVSTDIDHAAFGQLESARNYNHLYANDVTVSSYAGSSTSAEIFAGKTKGMASEWFINETGQDELLRAVSFGSPYSGYKYKIYVQIEDGDIQKLKEGYMNYAGIHTVRLDTGVLIRPDEAFNVFVALELPVKAKGNVGMFYSTGFDFNAVEAVGRPAMYYPHGDANFEDSVSTANVGDFPLIHALCYANFEDYDEENISLITIPDFDDRIEGAYRLTVMQTKNAEIQYENGVTLDALEDGSIFSQYKIEDKRKNANTAARAAAPEGAVEAKPQDATAAEPEDAAAVKPENAATVKTEEAAPAKPVKIATPSNYPREAKALQEDEDEEDENPFAHFLSGSKVLDVPKRNDPAKDIEDTTQYHTGLEHDPSAYTVDYRDYNGGVMKVDLPEKYNLSAIGQVTPVRNQGNSSQCWAFAAVKAVESAMMKNYQRLVTYPRGIELTAEGGYNIVNGVIDITYKEGETKTLTLKPGLVSDDETSLDNDMIVWTYEGDLDCINAMQSSTKNGEAVAVLTTDKGSGVVTVTASSRSDPNLMVTLTVRITEEVPAKIILSDSALDLKAGQSYTLNAEVTAAEDLKVVWTSDNTAVATVDRNGNVYAIKAGKAVITAKAGDASATCTVTVSGSGSRGGSSSGGRDSDSSSSGGSSVYSNGSGTQIVEGNWEQAADGSWFFTEKYTGRKSVGWRYIKTSDGQYHWFKFGQDTKMLTGWVRDPDGRWYYLAAEGDGTELSKAGQTGAMVTGWLTDPSDGHRYYLDLASGAMITGEKAMNGKKYFFNEYPAGATGWHFDEASQRWHFDGGIVIPMGALLREE